MTADSYLKNSKIIHKWNYIILSNFVASNNFFIFTVFLGSAIQLVFFIFQQPWSKTDQSLCEYFQAALLIYIHIFYNWNIMKTTAWDQNTKVDPKNEPNITLPI
jgi:hypothetical protein